MFDSPKYKYVLCLSYIGTNYSGWQIQNNADSIQGSIMNAINHIIDDSISLIVGAGRTDSGVHAYEFFAHFEYHSVINTEEITYRLNAFLPKDIVIHRIQSISFDFHARFSALSRKYEYWISQSKNPFLINRAYFFYKNLNLEIMNKGANMLVGEKNYISFSKSQPINPICNIKSAFWFKSKNMLVFSIEADRFLHNMVRCIVGTLINLGLQKIDLDDLQMIINSNERSKAGYSAPAEGLYLMSVQYPKKFQIESI